jgi:hypothetical protein
MVPAVALTVAGPSAAYLFTVPALAAAAVALSRLGGRRDAAWEWAAGAALTGTVLVVVYAPVMLLFAVLALRLDGMGMPILGVMGLFATLAAGLLIPVLRPPIATERRGIRWTVPAGSALVAIVLIAGGAMRLDYSRCPTALSFRADPTVVISRTTVRTEARDPPAGQVRPSAGP